MNNLKLLFKNENNNNLNLMTNFTNLKRIELYKILI